MAVNPKISLLIAAYNIEFYIHDCIASAINQTYQNIEIIVVDDGSTDNTSSIIEGFVLKDSRVVPIHKENGGLVSARKAGLETATGDYVFFLDGDDTIPRDAIMSLVNSLTDKTDIVVADYLIKKPNGEEIIKSYGYRSGDRFELLNSILKNALCSIWGNLYRRTLFEKVMLPLDLPKSIGEDLVTITQLIFFSDGEIKYLHAITYNYQIRETSLTGKKTEVNIWAAGFQAYLTTRDFINNKNIEDKIREGFLKITSTYLSGVLATRKGAKTYKKNLIEMAGYINCHWSKVKQQLSPFQKVQLRIACYNISVASFISRGWAKLADTLSR